MSNVIDFPGAGPSPNHGWAREKIEELVEALYFAAAEFRSMGLNPEILRPAVWNATKIKAWLTGEIWTTDAAESVLRGDS